MQKTPTRYSLRREVNRASERIIDVKYTFSRLCVGLYLHYVHRLLLRHREQRDKNVWSASSARQPWNYRLFLNLLQQSAIFSSRKQGDCTTATRTFNCTRHHDCVALSSSVFIHHIKVTLLSMQSFVDILLLICEIPSKCNFRNSYLH